MSGHTPGEWSLFYRPSGLWTVFKPAESDSEMERFYNGEWIHEGVNPANAHLIAAAPDLYAAAVWVLHNADGISKSGEDCVSPEEERASWDALMAATAKAEGR